jgi:hypothetical protein
MDTPKPLERVMKRAFVVIAVLLTVYVAQALPPANPRITGTYSNMHFIPEAGDVFGEELKVVVAGKGYQGVYQIAEGWPSGLVVTEIDVAGNRISFSLAGETGIESSFEGVVSNGVLRGQFTSKDGTVRRVVWKKGKSYWD